MAKYKDWRKFDPVTMRNEQIRNTPETARGGYSALDPLATITASVLTPDWAKRTTTEQARVNAAQARAQEQSASTPEATSGFGSYASLAPVSPYKIPNRVIPAPNSTLKGKTRLANSNKMPVREAETYGGVGNARTKEQSEAAWARAEADRASGRRIEETYAGWGNAPTKIDRTRPYADQLNPNRRMQDTYEGWAEKKPVGLKVPVRENETYGGWGDSPTKQDRARLDGKTPASEMDEGYIKEDARMEAIRNRMANRIPIREEETYAGRVVPEKENNADAGSPSTGETELTGYAKYLADHPEYAKADRDAEAEYARSLPTYGALAEQMAQMGIHGGYSDYLQGVAYAKMQDAKQQNEEAARAGYAALTGNGGAVMNENAKALYQNLLSEYSDQIAGITDETQYKQFEDLFRAANKGLYSDSDIEQVLKAASDYRTTNKTIDKDTIAQGIADYATGDKGRDDLLKTLGYDVTSIVTQNEGESVEDYQKRLDEAVEQNLIPVADAAYKNGRITKEQHSSILTTAMPINDEDFDKQGWKDKGEDIASSIALAVNGDLTDEDYKAVVDKVKEKLQSVGVVDIYYDHQGIGRSSDLLIKIRGGAGNNEDIRADQVGGDITDAEKNKLAQYGDLPLAYLVNSDGSPTLYYQNEHGWRQLRTKGGSTTGKPDVGNNWYTAIAFLMMNGYKPSESVTTSKNQTYTFITK